jgi:adenylate cyclase, class 2
MRRRNLELKALDSNHDRSLAICLALGARDCGWLRQVDTYFHVPKGRLKLREEEAKAQLIFYQRPNSFSARESRYLLIDVTQADELKAVLATVLGIATIVQKDRRLLLWEGVRIHLDRVANLGDCVEFEAVAETGSDLSVAHTRVAYLREAVGINNSDLLSESYGDVIVPRRPGDSHRNGERR